MVLKFFDLVLKFELPTARFLNFSKKSAAVLIRLVLIIRDCMYDDCKQSKLILRVVNCVRYFYINRIKDYFSLPTNW